MYGFGEVGMPMMGLVVSKVCKADTGPSDANGVPTTNSERKAQVCNRCRVVLFTLYPHELASKKEHPQRGEGDKGINYPRHQP